MFAINAKEYPTITRDRDEKDILAGERCIGDGRRKVYLNSFLSTKLHGEHEEGDKQKRQVDHGGHVYGDILLFGFELGHTLCLSLEALNNDVASFVYAVSNVIYATGEVVV